jgi:hypothetical protein
LTSTQTQPSESWDLKNVGDATLNAGSGGGYVLLTNGGIYGLGVASGQFGEADPKDKYLGSTDFDTTGFASSLFGGVIVPVASATKVDFRFGLNYLDAEAENHSGFGNLRLSDARIEQFSGSAAARLFWVWQYERMVVRPFPAGRRRLPFPLREQGQYRERQFLL